MSQSGIAGVMTTVVSRSFMGFSLRKMESPARHQFDGRAD